MRGGHIGLTIALLSGAFTVGTGVTAQAAVARVVINELNYHPEDDNPAAEFFELHNTTGAAINLSGWCVDGVSYCFPGGTTIAAGGFLVRNGTQYDGALSNGGEDISLLDNNGALVDFVEYDDKGSWPAMADGNGESLQRLDINSPTDDPGNWVSAAASPGATNLVRQSGLSPSFDDVEHTEYPTQGTPIEVEAELEGASAATMVYRIDFGNDVPVEMTPGGDGTFTATIPGQAAGALVRYRLIARNGDRVGRWPRQGDGMVFTGTTVQHDSGSPLPVFEIFMPDGEFDTMAADVSLSGDDGYPFVFAHEGQIFDRARIRVKGQISRYFTKKKFKIILPAGHDLESDLFPEDVDEFAIHSAWADRSFLRETLASELVAEAGTRAQQAFPVRIEHNHEFFGLYTYVEQPDGTYRDRYDLDDSEVYEVGPDYIFGLLAASDATRSQSSLRARYDKETFEHLGDDRLRSFISEVNRRSGTNERDWIYDNVDVPSVINIIAVSMVLQNQDWGAKNYRLIFDEHGRVGIAQNDYDLTFGRRWSLTKGALDTNVYVGGAFEHPGGPFFETFHYDAELSTMLKRRIRTITEELLDPAKLGPRVDELAALTRADALLDRGVWGTYGGSADPTAEAQRIMSSFVTPQYNRLLGTMARQGRVASTSQPAIPNVTIESVNYDGVESVVIRNNSADSVDLSSFEIPELELVLSGGTVLLPGRSAVVVHEDVGNLVGTYAPHMIAGIFEESLLDAPDGITLRNRQGAVVSTWDYLPPSLVTEISGEASRTALLNVVAVRNQARGFVQVLDCDDDPGDTASLTTDQPNQIRSALTLTRFDEDGAACLYNQPATHLVADVQGYFSPEAIDDVDDTRLIDTRSGAKPTAGSITKVSGGRPDATGIVGLFAVQTSDVGHITVIDCATAGTRPTTANIAWAATNSILGTLAFVQFDSAGEFCIYAERPTHVVVDLQGYLSDDGFDDTDDTRLLDTRKTGRPQDGQVIEFSGPADTTAVVALTAIRSAERGFMQITDCTTTPGSTANLNYDPGAVISGLSTVEFDADGKACIYVLRSVDIVVDLQGTFADGAFDDITDERVLDTR